jgi:hypothetical protein
MVKLALGWAFSICELWGWRPKFWTEKLVFSEQLVFFLVFFENITLMNILL